MFETFVINELRKVFLNRGELPLFYFWRDSNGDEVDLLDRNGRPPDAGGDQVRSDAQPGFFTGLERWMGLAGSLVCNPTLVYGGEGEHERKGVRVLGWERLGAVVSTMGVKSSKI